jgi:hypothetical protein
MFRGMSARALNWAWSQKPRTTTQKLVLAALADRADETGECFPSLRWIAERCQPMSEQTAKRAVGDLAEQGLLEKTTRKRKSNGDFSVWVYRLPISARAEAAADPCADVPGDTWAGITDEPAETTKDETKENPNGFSHLVDHWLAQPPPFVKHKRDTLLADAATRKLVERAIQENGYDDVIEAVSNYSYVLHSENHWPTHQWSMHSFFKQRNALPMFLPEADPVSNYRNRQPWNGRNRGLTFDEILNGSPRKQGAQPHAALLGSP